MAWKSILRKLDEMPKGLKQLYEYALSQSPDIGDTKKVLCIILAAYRPLSLGELNILLRVDGAKTVADLEMFLEPESRIEFVVRSLCGIFIYIADDKVHLIHETAREFLLGLDASEILGSKITFAESHEIVAHGCIAYLLIPDYRVYKGGVLSFYATRHWSDHNLECRRISRDPKMDILSRYNFGVPRPIDVMIAELCDPGNPNNIYSSISYNTQSALDTFSTSIVMGVIWGSNCQGRLVDGGSLLKEAIKRRYSIVAGLFFRFLEARLVENHWREALDEEISGFIGGGSEKITAHYIYTAELIAEFFQREELTPKLAIKALGDYIDNTRLIILTGHGTSDFVWSQINSFGRRSDQGDQDEIRRKNLLEWALLVSCMGRSTPGNQIPQLLRIQSFDRRLYSGMIHTILSLDQPSAESNLDLVMRHLRKDLGSDAYLEVLNETWEKAYQDGRHEAFEYLEGHKSIQYLATKDLDHAWLVAMRRSRYNSAKYFRNKGARYQFITLLYYSSCQDESDTGLNILGLTIESYLALISPSDVVSTDEANEILWVIFAVVTGIMASNLGSEKETLGPDLEFRERGLQHDRFFRLVQVHREDILVRSIDLVVSLANSLPGVFWGGPNAMGTDFSDPSKDDALIIANIFRLLACCSTWIRSYYGKWASEKLRTFRWEAELNESDRHVIGILELTLKDRDILDYPIESLTLKDATEAQNLAFAAILSYRPKISGVILGQTIPYMDVNAFFYHNPSDVCRNLDICLRTLLKRRWLGSFSGQVEEVPQLEDSIRDFIRALAFGPTPFHLNPLGLAVRLQNYEAMQLLASYGADPWIEAGQLYQRYQVQGLSAMACATRNDLQTSSSISGPAPQNQGGGPRDIFLAMANAMGVDLRVNFGKAGNLTGKTLLHYAIEHSNESVINLLLDLGASTSVVDNEMRTALHVAATLIPSDQNFGILLEIIERDGGKSPEKLDNKDRTPYELAKSFHVHNDEYWERISGPLKDAELMSLSFIQRNWESSVERVANSQSVEGKVDDWMEFSDTDIWEEDTEDSLSD
ncbi:hypothetical protein TWF788_004212 [Orbilia oligospora]|uniref:GPI inositol-deacylase winged helix domain-containing protein n=1 Tax=Orbilia oligospora TaxID=2813651 RepID=A0A7C8Q4K0_ORBOL|nr:hypothetical protein TWF788_004212 [Orbilia oligospora]